MLCDATMGWARRAVQRTRFAAARNLVEHFSRSQYNGKAVAFEGFAFRHLRAFGDNSEKQLTSASSSIASLPLVYESPLGSAVSKLRTVSLVTAIIGATGVPCMIAIKGAVPEMGMLAVAMMFVTGSIGSTAAIHFVFSPYVYRIESIPVRQCSVKVDNNHDTTDRVDRSDSCQNETINAHNAVDKRKDLLLKAWTRSVFLQNKEIVFDPEIDVEPYTGMRPLCNFRAKGIPLYIHPEYVYDAKLRHAMKLSEQAYVAPLKANPDDDLL